MHVECTLERDTLQVAERHPATLEPKHSQLLFGGNEVLPGVGYPQCRRVLEALK